MNQNQHEREVQGLGTPRAGLQNLVRPRAVVLVVEDSDDDYYLLHRAFKKLNADADLLHIKEGAQAINYLAGQKGQSSPSLLLLDLKLPGASGFDVLKWIRNDPEFKVLPVNVLSSSAEPADIQQAFELGANAFTVKPMGLDEYEHLVATLCKFWLELSQLPRRLSS